MFKATGQRSAVELADAGAYLPGSPGIPLPVGCARPHLLQVAGRDPEAAHTCGLCQRKLALG